MQRLSGLDAAFLYLETPTNFLHVAGVGVFDAADMPGGYSFEKVREVVERGLPSVPRFRMRVRSDLFRLSHPMWVDDPEFTLDNHVTQVPLESGIDLAEEISSQLAEPLDRSRPLWRLTVFEASDTDRVAVMVTCHHAALDGVSAASVMQRLFGSNARSRPDAAEPARQPAPGELTLRALASVAQLPAKYVRVWSGSGKGRTSGDGASAPDADADAEVSAPESRPTPSTPFNRALVGGRSVSFASLDLDEMKGVAAEFGTTVNDVLLAVCAGAIRQYLRHVDALPEGPLRALMPVSLRAGDDDGSLGNQVGASAVVLRTDISSTRRRLAVMAGTSGRGRDAARSASGGPDVSTVAELLPPTLTSALSTVYSRLRLSNLHRPLVNVLISNVPGPPGELDVAGAPVRQLYPFGPIVDGIGLNLTAISYGDWMHIGVLGDEEGLAEPDLLADRIESEFDSLVGG